MIDEQGADELRDNVAMQQEQGVETNFISPAEISTVAPGYAGEGAALACYEAATGVADPMATTYCFAKGARDHGASIREGVAVTRILTSGESLTGVQASQGDLHAPVVGIAANAWSVALAPAAAHAVPL